MVWKKDTKSRCWSFRRQLSLKELESLDISSMTPLAALIRLYELQQQARESPDL